MCFGITKMYYKKKNLGHDFKKPVQIERTTQKHLAVIFFLRNLHMCH